MLTRYQTLLLAAFAIPALVCTAAASAQNAPNARDKRPPDTTGSAVSPGVPSAPVGHRQPRAADIPADTPKTATEERQAERDRELDKKLWICRGC